MDLCTHSKQDASGRYCFGPGGIAKRYTGDSTFPIVEQALNIEKFIVAGGSSGIGLGVAQAALQSGAEVVLVGRSPEKLQRAAAELGGGPRLRTHAADVTAEDEVRRLFEAAGDCDHLVSTVADLRYQPLREMPLADIRQSLESKLLSAVLLAKHGAAHIRAGGSLLFVSGVASQRPSPNGALTAAVNGGLDALARALALELAPVRVNTVSPGWVDTPFWDRLAGTGKQERLAQKARQLPAGRIGTPQDLGQAVLAVARNGFITGTTLTVDGGHRLV
jgi:NAD(P)-dependent dehydrogenase (short-subunit alcohol dehydrogenase family)